EDNGAPARRWGAYGLAVLLCLGALLAKTTAFSLPAVIVLIRWWKRGRVRWREDVVPTLPMFAMAISFCLMTAWLEKTHVGAQGPDFALTFPERCLIAGRVPWFYIGKLLWPVNLCFVYPRWRPDAGSWRQWLYPAAAVGVLVALWLARRRMGRGPAAAAFFFVGTLFPLLGFFNAYGMRYSLVWDHWVYLPSLGLIALAVAAVGRVLRQPSAQFLAGAVAITVLGVLSWQHGKVFHDEETLWRDVITRNPGCAIAHVNLATVLIGRGNYAEALEQCEEALRIEPDNAPAHDNWGSILLQTGKPQEAIEQYERAVQIRPDDAEAQYNYGNALFQVGRVPEAIGHYEQAVRINPNVAAAQYNLGNALLHVGRVEEAIGHYEQAVQVSPDNAGAYAKLGTALALVGRVREAIPEFEQALRLKPDDPEAQNNLAWLLATVPPGQGGDPGRAVALAERACGLTGRGRAAPLDTLAVAYGAAGRFDEAIHTAEECLTLARSAGPTQLVTDVQAQIDLFRAGQPYRGRADSR
ncbi:MAG: tetratricopeptide repeat protein, partial [Verrucomicrobiia bacterium]